MLVLVGTPGAADSKFVREEVDTFSRARSLRGHRPLLPISFGDALDKVEWQKLTGLYRTPETQEALATQYPSEAVIRLIEDSYKYTKRNQRARWFSVFALALLLFSSAASGLAWQQRLRAIEEGEKARTEGRRAETEAATARRNADNARQQEARALEQTRLAKEHERLAKENERKAKENAAKALQRSNLARRNKARAEAEAERAEASAQLARQQEQLAREKARTANSQELASLAVAERNISPDWSHTLVNEPSSWRRPKGPWAACVPYFSIPPCTPSSEAPWIPHSTGPFTAPTAGSSSAPMATARHSSGTRRRRQRRGDSWATLARCWPPPSAPTVSLS
jgi:hypothetical protein